MANKKISPNEIQNIREDWSNDERVNLPYGGWAV